jgi:hypothetical protein
LVKTAFVAEIQHFLRIQHPTDPGVVLRLAMSDVLPAEPCKEEIYRDNLTEFSMVVVKGVTPTDTCYPCVISDMACPLTLMKDKRTKIGTEEQEEITWFFPVLFNSNRVRVEQY